MVLEIELQHAESIHTPRADSNSRIYAAIAERTAIEPVLQVHVIKFLGTYGIEIQIPSATTKDRSSWVVICRGKNRFVDESLHRDPRHNPTSKLLLGRSIAKESEPCATELEQSRIEETHAQQSKIPANPVTIRKKKFLLEKRSGMICLPADPSMETLFQPKSQNWS